MQNFTTEAILALRGSQAPGSSSMPSTPTPAHPKPRPQQQHPVPTSLNSQFMKVGPRSFNSTGGRPPIGAFLKHKKPPAASAMPPPPPPPPKLAPTQLPVQVEPESEHQPEPESQSERVSLDLSADLSDDESDQDELDGAEGPVERVHSEASMHETFGDESKEFASASMPEFESDREYDLVDAGGHKRNSDTWDEESDIEDNEDQPVIHSESPAAKRVRTETISEERYEQLEEQHEQYILLGAYPQQPADANAADPTPHTTRAAKLIAEMTDPNPWEGATLEEWKAGGDELATRFGDLMIRVVRLVERKATRQAALQAEMDAHKASLAERSRKMDGTGKNVGSWVALLNGPKD